MSLLICMLFVIGKSQWISPLTPLLPTTKYGAAVGVYNQSILLISGYPSNDKIITYDIAKNNVSASNVPYLSPQEEINYSVSQYYTSVNQKIYMADYNYLSFYNMRTKLYAKQWQSLPNPYSAYLPCLASTSNYIFVNGGWRDGVLSEVYAWDLTLSVWITDWPSLKTARREHACIADPSTNKLYAIGGFNLDTGYLSSIERIYFNVTELRSWTGIGSLANGLIGVRAVIHAQSIFAIGGCSYTYSNTYQYSNLVHVIDTNTDEVSVSPDQLVYAVSTTAAVVITSKIYAFGGRNDDGNLGTWMYYEISTDHTHATTEPTNGASTEPTNDPITKPQNHTTKATSLLSTIDNILLSVILLFLIIIGIFLYKCNRSKSRMHAKTIYMKNPMVIAVAIGDYDNNPTKPDIFAYFADLKGIGVDIENVIQTFGKSGLNYDIFPDYSCNNINSYRTRWTQDELINFFKSQANKLEYNLNHATNHSYDGLVVVISCHGVERYIISSDSKKMSKTAIHRIFSAKRPSIRQIPRLFIFDCCAGEGDKLSESRVKSEAGKYFEMHDIARPNSMWAHNEENPDYRLVIVNASNEGFQSKMRLDTGSYVVTKITEQVAMNVIHKGNKKFLNDILDGIQEELHRKGKQLMVNTFNNKTGFIKFKAKRKESCAVEMQDLNEYALLTE
eukprot:146252_1